MAEGSVIAGEQSILENDVTRARDGAAALAFMKRDPAVVAKDGWDALMAGKASIFSGFAKKVQSVLANVMPASVLAEQAGLSNRYAAIRTDAIHRRQGPQTPPPSPPRVRQYGHQPRPGMNQGADVH